MISIFFVSFKNKIVTVARLTSGAWTHDPNNSQNDRLFVDGVLENFCMIDLAVSRISSL